jgi:hypothetical protein
MPCKKLVRDPTLVFTLYTTSADVTTSFVNPHHELWDRVHLPSISHAVAELQVVTPQITAHAAPPHSMRMSWFVADV